MSASKEDAFEAACKTYSCFIEQVEKEITPLERLGALKSIETSLWQAVIAAAVNTSRLKDVPARWVGWNIVIPEYTMKEWTIATAKAEVDKCIEVLMVKKTSRTIAQCKYEHFVSLLRTETFFSGKADELKNLEKVLWDALVAAAGHLSVDASYRFIEWHHVRFVAAEAAPTATTAVAAPTSAN